MDACEKLKNGGRFAAARGSRDVKRDTGVGPGPPQHEILQKGFIEHVAGIDPNDLGGRSTGKLRSLKPRDHCLGRKSEVLSRNASCECHWHSGFRLFENPSKGASENPPKTS